MYIKVEELTKSYDEQVVVDNVSFEVKQGEILGFLGPNGAGKSTTMKIITNFVSPDAGQVIVNDKNVTHQSDIGVILLDIYPKTILCI